MSKILNFFPYYKNLLLKGKKNTTIRLPNCNHSFTKGEIVSITTGWSEDSCIELFKAKIISIETRKINELNEEDLEGESPDCKSIDAIPYVIGCIYRKVLASSDEIKVIKFKKYKGK